MNPWQEAEITDSEFQICNLKSEICNELRRVGTFLCMLILTGIKNFARVKAPFPCGALRLQWWAEAN
jgi:hypothetical protein